jgi:hypothetical protein
LPFAYGVTDNYLKENPNTIHAFLKGIAEGVARTKSDPAAAKRAIGKFTQTNDLKVIDETYDFYAPYWVTSLALRPEQFQTWFGYLNDKEYPLVKKAEPKTFTITRLEILEKSGFFQKISQAGQTKQSFLYVAITGNETHYRCRLVKGLAVYTTRPPTMVSTDSMERIWSSGTVR